jgi:hypothetical protein
MLWDVESPTFSRQSAHRWRWGCQPCAPLEVLIIPDTGKKKVGVSAQSSSRGRRCYEWLRKNLAWLCTVLEYGRHEMRRPVGGEGPHSLSYAPDVPAVSISNSHLYSYDIHLLYSRLPKHNRTFFLLYIREVWFKNGLRCVVDDRGVGVWVPIGSRIFSSPCRPDRLWDPPNLLCNGYRGLCPRGWSGRGVKLTTPASAEVTKMWIYTSTPPYAFMA